MNKNFGIVSNTMDKLTKPIKPIISTVKKANATVKKISNNVKSVKSAMDRFIASQSDKNFAVGTSGAIDFNQSLALFYSKAENRKALRDFVDKISSMSKEEFADFMKGSVPGRTRLSNKNEDIDMNVNFSKSGTQRDIDQSNLFKSVLYTAKFMAEAKNLNSWKDFIPVYQKMFEQINANMDPEAWIDATGIPYIKNYCKEAKLSSVTEKMWIDAFSGLMMGILKMK